MTTMKRADSDCATGGLYVEPELGNSYPAGTPLTASWTTDCISSATVDIYLYAPAVKDSQLHKWTNVPNDATGYNLTVNPTWFDSKTSVKAQLRIVARGEEPFLSTAAAGPVFTLTSDGSGSTDDGSQVTVVGAASTASTSSSRGKIAAAVVIPLLFAIVAVVFYVRWLRQKRAGKSAAFTEHVDKRMSTISTDWKSLSGKGASAAIRNSMAVGEGNRNSGFSFGNIRPQSSFDADNGPSSPEMAQVRAARPRPSFNTGERVSRVSFAEGTRPSVETRRSMAGQSRAFHNAFVPPLPDRQSSADDLAMAGAMSPTQTFGAVPLTSEAIHSRISSVTQEDVGPALSMMRMQEDYSTSDLSRMSTYTAGNSHTMSVYGSNNPYASATDIVSAPQPVFRSETLFSAGSPLTSPTVESSNSPFGHAPKNFGVSPDALLQAYAAGLPTSTGPGMPGAMRVMSPPATPSEMQSPVRGAYDVNEDVFGRAQ